MDYEATQVVNDRRATNSDNSVDKTQIGILKIGNEEFKIVEGFNRIGRSTLCNVLIRDVTVSKVHAEIQAGLDAAFICDLRSANGTTFKGLPLKPFFFYPIHDRDTIIFGQAKAVYRILKPLEKRNEDKPESMDVSMVPGTVRKANKRLFRRPAIPIDHGKRKDTISDSESEMTKETDEACPNIDTIDMDELETQRVIDLEYLGPVSTKKPRLETASPSVVDTELYDAETLASLANEKKTVESPVRIVDNSKESGSKKKLPMRVPNVIIAESDDESSTDDEIGNIAPRNAADDLSDSSVTDAEDTFANLGTNSKRKNERRAPSRQMPQATSKKQPQYSAKTIHDAATQRQVDSGQSTSSRYYDRTNANEVDIDLLPTQILDVATSTPMKGRQTERMDNLDTAETQIMDDAPVDAADPNPRTLLHRGIGKRKVNTNTRDTCNEPTQMLSDVPVYEADSGSKVSQFNGSEARKFDTTDEDLFNAPTQRISIDNADSSLKISPQKESKNRKVEMTDQDIFDAPTQAFEIPRSNNPGRKLSLSTSSKNRKLEVENPDIFDAPTQPFELPVGRADTSCKTSPLNDSEKCKLETSHTDISDAPTQVFDIPDNQTKSKLKVLHVKDSAKRADEANDQNVANAAKQDTNEVSVDTSHSSSKVSSVQRKEKNGNNPINLDDSIGRNLNNIFGGEANTEDDPMDEQTPLLTQNLVDILKPTQNFRDSTTRNVKKSPRSAQDDIPLDKSVDNVQESPRRRSSRGISGSVEAMDFVDAQAVKSHKVSAGPSMTNKNNTDDKTEAADESARGHPSASGNNEEDDVLFGLPEVKLYGTLSNPGSPTPSPTSSHIDLLPPSSRTSDDTEEQEKNVTRTSKRVAGRPRKARTLIVDKVEELESNESDSPIQPVKSYNRKKTRNRIIDEEHDSDDPFDYNDLKTIADKLLASGGTKDTTVENRTKNVAKQPSRIGKNVETNNNPTKSRRTRNLSKTSTSFIVPDNASDISKDSDEAVTTAQKTVDKKARMVEKDENAIKKKAYVTVKLTRLNDNDTSTSRDSTKATRSKQLTSVSLINLSPSPPPVSRSRTRRTVDPTFASRKWLDEEHPQILFTGIKDADDYEKMVVKLGGSVVSDSSKATILISDKIRRTFKFMCSIAQGIKVVSIDWLIESNKTGRFLDCDSFILKDPAAEAKYKFELPKSLEIAKSKRLLDGYTIVVTPKVNQPAIHELKDMIEAAGGRLFVRSPRRWSAQSVIISKPDDLAAAKVLLSKAPKSFKITVQSIEFILTGILRQEVNLVEHKLI